MSEQENVGVHRECFKCGESIRMRVSAYEDWDEQITLKWTPDSEDDDFIQDKGGNGLHPESTTWRFCSVGCLESFIEMDYNIKPDDNGGAGN